MRRLGVWLAVLLFLSPFAMGQLGGQNDAGSGQDAPDAPQPEVFIASGEVYQGELRDGDRHDWYAFHGEAGQRVQARVSGLYGCWEIARDVDQEAGATCARAPGAEVGTLEVVLPSTGTWYLHYQNVPADVYRFSIGLDEPAGSPTGAPPAPDPGSLEGGQDDASSGEDAPDVPRPSIPIASGIAYTGELTGLLGGDEDDWYVFEAQAGDEVTAVTRGTVHCYEITEAGGQPIDFGCSTVGLDAFASGLTVTIPEDGTHYLHVYYFVPQRYSFSIGINEAPADLGPLPPAPAQAPSATGQGTGAPIDGPPGPGPAGTTASSPAAWAAAAQRQASLPLDLEGTREEVVLWENDRLIAPEAALRDAGGYHLSIDGVTLIAGHLADEPGAIVRATVHEDRITGHLYHPDRGTWTLATDDEGQVHLLSPAQRATVAPGARGPIDPVTVPTSHAGGCLSATPHYVANPLGLALGWPARTLDVAFAVDHSFTQAYGSGSIAQALAYVNDLDGFYTAQLDLGIRLVDLHAHQQTTLDAENTGDLLVQLQDHYAAVHSDVDRENVHLFTGTEMTGAVGQANCVGGAGDPAIAYTVGEALDNGALEFFGLQWFPDTALKIAAHEIGHILSGHHHYSNCGAERLPFYDPVVTFDACTLMINDVGLASLQFSTMNKLVTRGWADIEDL